VQKAIKNNINCPLTSSAGRLFDAAAALVGICNYTSFHAEAPMRLENIIDNSENSLYSFEIGITINPKSVITGIVNDVLNKAAASTIAAKFHRTIIEIIIQGVMKIKKETGLNKVILSGGTFQNRFILKESEERLSGAGYDVFSSRDFPSNDGGIALGQMAIAARRRQKRICDAK
jgi:hydrogenase maturation protein HypF